FIYIGIKKAQFLASTRMHFIEAAVFSHRGYLYLAGVPTLWESEALRQQRDFFGGSDNGNSLDNGESGNSLIRN
ncbi:MAG: hypothetical protein WBQ43_17360, partial [Terriglobales bacterium]